MNKVDATMLADLAQLGDFDAVTDETRISVAYADAAVLGFWGKCGKHGFHVRVPVSHALLDTTPRQVLWEVQYNIREAVGDIINAKLTVVTTRAAKRESHD